MALQDREVTKCPHCRVEVHVEDFKSPYSRAVMNIVKAKCPGCSEWHYGEERFNKHVRECAKISIKCPLCPNETYISMKDFGRHSLACHPHQDSSRINAVYILGPCNPKIKYIESSIVEHYRRTKEYRKTIPNFILFESFDCLFRGSHHATLNLSLKTSCKTKVY